MPWKILIADDEPMIRADLRETVLAALPECAIVAEAEDGEEALRLAVQTKPDILLVDIRMPFVNGLELIDRLGALDADWLVIVVTGHDEFEYARAALSLGVFEFLLKPVDEALYADALRRAAAEIGLRRERAIQNSRLRAELERNLPYLRRRLFGELAAGRTDAAEALPRLATLGIEIPDPAGLTLVRLGEGLLSPNAADVVEREVALESILEELFAPFSPFQIFDDAIDGLVALSAEPGGEAWADLPAEISARVELRLGRPAIVSQRIVRGGAPIFAAELGEDIEELREEAGPPGDQFVERARSYIERNYMRPELSLEETAQTMAVSPDHLSRLMKRETGKSFVEYLMVYRVTRAMALMARHDVKMFEVAELAGFSSQHYFSRVFRRISGLSPTEYRREAAP
jgi:two-component system response regulator YesN